MHQQALVRGPVGVIHAIVSPPKSAGCDVVRMPLHLGGERQQGRGVEVDDALEQARGGHQAGDDRGGGGAQAAAVRDRVRGVELEAGLRDAGVLETAATARTTRFVSSVGTSPAPTPST